MKFVIGFVAALAAIIALGLAIPLSGAFNVAATNPDSALTTWFLNTTMRRSVAMRSSAIVPPKSFSDEEVRTGFEEFSAMCVMCHGAPGKKRSKVGKGLRPQAPNLVKAVPHWNAGQLFWIVKNGIKMTGMPAFGPTHNDATIWSIVAFVSRLPDMTEKQYQQLEEQMAGSHGHSDGHAH